MNEIRDVSQILPWILRATALEVWLRPLPRLATPKMSHYQGTELESGNGSRYTSDWPPGFEYTIFLRSGEKW